MPDGAITGNGDLSVIWGGTCDRIQLYVGKSDFWKGSSYIADGGGHSPLGIIELLLPHMAYAPYHVEQDMDNCLLTGYFVEGRFEAKLTVAVCATENVILLELEHSFPGISASVNLVALSENNAVCKKIDMGNLSYVTRSFEGPDLFFPTTGIMVLKEINRTHKGERCITRWTVHVCTNHDSAAYCENALSASKVADNNDFDRLLKSHSDWWNRYWSASSLEISDELLENHWYMGMYIMACCSRNRNFPPGSWGNFSTSDNMDWQGDYHLNYNYEAPFIPLCVANHVELTDCYDAPLRDFLPVAKQYAKEYTGCRGVYFPVCIGPLGMECDIKHETKEHGHLFLGQKSHAVYATVIMAMRWYTTYDETYAIEHILPFMLEVADFWEDYLVYENRKYWSFNDSLFEVAWWRGPDYMPENHNQINPLSSVGFVRMMLKCLIDICTTLDIHQERITKWSDIVENFGPAQTAVVNKKTRISIWNEDAVGLHISSKSVELNEKKVLRSSEHSDILEPYVLEYIYPANEISSRTTPELFDAAKYTFELLNPWSDERMPYNVCPSAVRLGIDPKKITERMHYIISKHQLPNGVLDYMGGGIENSAIVPATLQEMMLQSHEHVIRLFPNWDVTQPASFTNWRAYGAFIVSASITDGFITAEIISGKGKTLSIEKPGNGYFLYHGDKCIPLIEQITSINTKPGDIFIVKQ